MSTKKTYKILAMIQKKEGGTFWMRVGTAYLNKDDSINAYVDAFPREGKLQLRELDESDLRDREARRGAAQQSLASATTAIPADAPF